MLSASASRFGYFDCLRRSASRFLKNVQLRPHKNKGWGFTTEKDQELFQKQSELVCQTYTRHGTVCLTGNWDVAAGQFLLPTIEETRNNGRPTEKESLEQSKTWRELWRSRPSRSTISKTDGT